MGLPRLILVSLQYGGMLVTTLTLYLGDLHSLFNRLIWKRVLTLRFPQSPLKIITDYSDLSGEQVSI